ncbi:ATP-NAD kinase-like domain-containing protein [Fimicolochytrium jonesii]|uniref:ATP-NAD kinase-like domain-containing protein n=1 Tax=Fimicolochytrium jonesii TaxID=1396493 RepID=UPI0022FE3F73|nr:ATP-NAD kinase-like domain-containing protein [Fimicolochytrium jonesii]KAI8817945.1 ATP-NAD kinase-like domain-containing protein [Fimicolochytrium jonesii]
MGDHHSDASTTVARSGKIPVIAFYNTSSGSQRAESFSRLQNPVELSDDLQLWCYDLRDKERFVKGVSHVQQVVEVAQEPRHGSEQQGRPKCIVLSCGGDGTIPAVVAALHARSVPVFNNSQVVFGVLPFGTANILSRFLGWGTTMDKTFADDLAGLIGRLASAPVAMVDVMEVTVVGARDPEFSDKGRKEKGSQKKDHDKSRSSGEEQDDVEEKRFMMLQACIGFEARLARFVEKHRTSNRLCNMFVSSMNVIRQLIVPHPHIERVIKSIQSPSPGWRPHIIASHPCVQLNIQNIPAAANKDHSLWNSNSSEDIDENKENDNLCPQKVDDGQCEVFVYPCKHRYLLNNLHAALGVSSDVDALGQVKLPINVEFDTSKKLLSETYIFIDGEHIPLKRPRSLSVRSPGRVAFAIHPDNVDKIKDFISARDNLRDSAISLV